MHFSWTRTCLFAMTSSVAPASFSWPRRSCSWARHSSSLRKGNNEHQTHTQHSTAPQRSKDTHPPPSIHRVHNPDDSVGQLEVVPPVRSYRLLTANVPQVQCITIVLQRFYVESHCGGYFWNIFSRNLFHYGGFPCTLHWVQGTRTGQAIAEFQLHRIQCTLKI